jgi:hypothetical protein
VAGPDDPEPGAPALAVGVKEGEDGDDGDIGENLGMRAAVVACVPGTVACGGADSDATGP